MLSNAEAPRTARPVAGSSLTSLVITLAGLALAGYLFWDQRAALAYFFGSTTPIDLGAPGAYRLEAERDNSFARITGTLGRARNRFELLGTKYEIAALDGTNVLVRRSEPAGNAEGPAAFEGRLIADTSIPQYGEAFTYQVQNGGAQPMGGRLFVLLDGERPRAGWQAPALLAAVLALVALNGFSLLRQLRRRAAGQRPAGAGVDAGE